MRASRGRGPVPASVEDVAGRIGLFAGSAELTVAGVSFVESCGGCGWGWDADGEGADMMLASRAIYAAKEPSRIVCLGALRMEGRS